MPRQTIHFAGHVQGVGFRATTEHIAQNFVIAGYVQNLHDGRVRLVAEGDADELRAFLAAVRQRLGRFIHDEQADSGPDTGEFGAPAPGALTVRH